MVSTVGLICCQAAIAGAILVCQDAADFAGVGAIAQRLNPFYETNLMSSSEAKALVQQSLEVEVNSTLGSKDLS